SLTVSGLNTQPEKVIGLSACAAPERTLLAASQVPRTPAFLRNVRRSIVLMGTLSLGLGRLGRRRVLACAHVRIAFGCCQGRAHGAAPTSVARYAAGVFDRVSLRWCAQE